MKKIPRAQWEKIERERKSERGRESGPNEGYDAMLNRCLVYNTFHV